MIRLNRELFENLYRRYNRRDFVHPDPIEILYDYPDVRDREIVALLAASLAYGRAAQISRSVRAALSRMGRHPAAYLRNTTPRRIGRDLSGYRHRFTSGADVAALLTGIRAALSRYGSLHACFLQGLDSKDATVLPALRAFTARLVDRHSHFVPCPSGTSPCKRLNLFLRWMVRQDAVDPGGWQGISPGLLIVPLDTHMQRIAHLLGLTRRRSPNLAMALDITERFRAFSPDDPVKYDFALTRFGIRRELSLQMLADGSRS
jgi:uncharacterized protein (TIGR02757 family)